MSKENDSDDDLASSRRRALGLLLGGASVAVGALLAWPVAQFLRPLGAGEVDAVAEVSEGEIGLWEAKMVLLAGRPIVVVNTGEGYQALSAVCSHLGCIVKWQKGRRQFFCPCHGGRFDLDGQVLGGPARRPLARLEVEASEGRVLVRKA